MSIQFAAVYEYNSGWDMYGAYPTNDKIKAVLEKILRKLTNQTQDKTITSENANFHIQILENIAIAAVSKSDVPQRVVYQFLKDAHESYAADKPSSASTFLKKKVKHFDPSSDKVLAVKDKMRNVKNGLMETMDQALDRGEDLDLLDDKAIDLEHSARDTSNRSKTLKRQMYIRLLLGLFILFGIVCCLIVVLIVIILLFACVFPATRGNCFNSQ